MFDASWRSRCSVVSCKIGDVSGFVYAHYLHKKPAIVLLCMKVLLDGEPAGCIIYSAPPKQVDVRYGGITWELSRLFLIDSLPRNAETWVISKSVKWIKGHYRHVKNIISYADPSAGHTGTIYKAANFKPDGMTDDDRKTPRCDYYDSLTGEKYGRMGNIPPDAAILRKPRVSKYRFRLEV